MALTSLRLSGPGSHRPPHSGSTLMANDLDVGPSALPCLRPTPDRSSTPQPHRPRRNLPTGAASLDCLNGIQDLYSALEHSECRSHSRSHRRGHRHACSKRPPKPLAGDDLHGRSQRSPSPCSRRHAHKGLRSLHARRGLSSDPTPISAAISTWTPLSPKVYASGRARDVAKLQAELLDEGVQMAEAARKPRGHWQHSDQKLPPMALPYTACTPHLSAAAPPLSETLGSLSPENGIHSKGTGWYLLSHRPLVCDRTGRKQGPYDLKRGTLQNISSPKLRADLPQPKRTGIKCRFFAEADL
uniref:Uncharacterized protein n=1 Tax=Eutreptiella gymnastica TaxID=73025 RepID=A0A7S1IQ15_9EUGL